MISEHVWAGGKCIVCGASAWSEIRSQAIALGKGDPGPADYRQCLERDDYNRAVCPEPARRVPACEDDSIARRIAELRAEQDAAWNATEQ